MTLLLFLRPRYAPLHGQGAPATAGKKGKKKLIASIEKKLAEVREAANKTWEEQEIKAALMLESIRREDEEVLLLLRLLE